MALDFDIDASDLLYIVGIALGVVAVVYFGREIIADLSPTIKSIILLIAFPTFLVSGNLINKRILDKFFYVLSVLSYIVFLWYIIDTFSLGTNAVFLALVVSSILFIGMGYQWQRGLKISKGLKRGILVSLLIIILAFVSFDVIGSQPSYELDFQDRVSFEGAWEGGEESIPIGTLEVKNDFLFSRHTDPPRLYACIYTPEKHTVYLDYPRWDLGIVSGRSSEKIEVSLRPPWDRETDGRPIYMENIESLPIEVAHSCPEEVDEPKLVIATGEGELYLPQETVTVQSLN